MRVPANKHQKYIFWKKNDNQCLVICELINFEKENKITNEHGFFFVKYQKYDEKNHFTSVFFLDIIFLKFVGKKLHETSVNWILIIFKNCYQITLLP